MTSNVSAASELHSSGFFNPVVEQCEGCERIVEANNNKYCQTYAFPDAKWRLGICNFATHKKPEIIVDKIRVNPLKASKRASAKKK
ncbi:MAG: PxxKW family cysteine-rich protein [Desulfobulbaceae bacterium]|nr:PxxKW family cysteine-rich protein [Desulfobulbaceae bacterium]